ncbi:hypothetical protein B0T17DRAFT_333869 [Bombardia bombarda]|uniref:Uncharacterized protein n=1 Tax=Bombardia bombarda TaxID=252184 RepID=A0AA39WMV6_9PEZI|nr:hypothetical protein B0T17DRAFT_333869 [Bombardia bombarda]
MDCLPPQNQQLGPRDPMAMPQTTGTRPKTKTKTKPEDRILMSYPKQTLHLGLNRISFERQSPEVQTNEYDEAKWHMPPPQSTQFNSDMRTKTVVPSGAAADNYHSNSHGQWDASKEPELNGGGQENEKGSVNGKGQTWMDRILKKYNIRPRKQKAKSKKEGNSRSQNGLGRTLCKRLKRKLGLSSHNNDSTAQIQQQQQQQHPLPMPLLQQSMMMDGSSEGHDGINSHAAPYPSTNPRHASQKHANHRPPRNLAVPQPAYLESNSESASEIPLEPESESESDPVLDKTQADGHLHAPRGALQMQPPRPSNGNGRLAEYRGREYVHEEPRLKTRQGVVANRKATLASSYPTPNPYGERHPRAHASHYQHEQTFEDADWVPSSSREQRGQADAGYDRNIDRNDGITIPVLPREKRPQYQQHDAEAGPSCQVPPPFMALGARGGFPPLGPGGIRGDEEDAYAKQRWQRNPTVPDGGSRPLVFKEPILRNAYEKASSYPPPPPPPVAMHNENNPRAACQTGNNPPPAVTRHLRNDHTRNDHRVVHHTSRHPIADAYGPPTIPERFSSSRWRPRSSRRQRKASVESSSAASQRASWNPFNLPSPPRNQPLFGDSDWLSLPRLVLSLRPSRANLAGCVRGGVSGGELISARADDSGVSGLSVSGSTSSKAAAAAAVITARRDSATVPASDGRLERIPSMDSDSDSDSAVGMVEEGNGNGKGKGKEPEVIKRERIPSQAPAVSIAVDDAPLVSEAWWKDIERVGWDLDGGGGPLSS